MDWKSVEDILNSISNQKYVFLRNFQAVCNEFSEDDDWDILCDNMQTFIKEIKAKPLNSNTECYNYYVNVGRKKLYLDIRCVGDGYYDEKWERDMLDSRIFKDGMYILNNVNYINSIVYHCLVHKDSIDYDKYKKVLINSGRNINEYIENLSLFMMKNGYRAVVPNDKGVKFNEENYSLIQERI